MQTMLATFDDNATAQRAIEALIGQGFNRANVHLQGVPATTGAASGESSTGTMKGVGNFFSNLFGSDSETHAGHYSEAVRRGSSVVAIDAQNDAQLDQAKALMQKMGSIDVDARADQWKKTGWSGFDPNSKPLSAAEQAADQQSLKVVQEDIQVGKRTVDVGGLRVIKRISETPVSQIVSLKEEHATIERRPVNRAAPEADFANFKEGTIEVRETTEEVVVGKTARVVEEVVVGKAATERSETVSDTVRRTDVDVERIAGTDTTATKTIKK